MYRYLLIVGFSSLLGGGLLFWGTYKNHSLSLDASDVSEDPELLFDLTKDKKITLKPNPSTHNSDIPLLSSFGRVGLENQDLWVAEANYQSNGIELRQYLEWLQRKLEHLISLIHYYHHYSQEEHREEIQRLYNVWAAYYGKKLDELNKREGLTSS